MLVLLSLLALMGLVGYALHRLSLRRLEGEMAKLRLHLADTEKELLDNRRFLERKMEEMARYTYTVSHDLRSPLTTIVGFLHLLHLDLKEGKTEAVERDLTRLQLAATKMGALFAELDQRSRSAEAGAEAESAAPDPRPAGGG